MDEFEALDARAYRALDTEAYLERRKLVVGLAGEMPDDATEEQMRSIDAELDIIKEEDARRDKLIALRNHKMAQVINGLGEKKEETREAGAEQRAMTLGERVAAQVQERGFQRGEEFTLSNIAFRAATDANLNPSLESDYGKATLVKVDDEIREGYRQPLTIESLFGAEVTEKDAVTWFSEGAVEGAPAMTAEAGAYSQLHFEDPQSHSATLKKVTAFWKNSDEILTDSPRLVTHIDRRADYMMDLKKEQQLLLGDGKGNNILGLLATPGLATDTFKGVDLDLVDALLDYAAVIMKSTPNFVPDVLLCSIDDFNALQKLKDDNKQYVLGGPTSTIYGQQVPIERVLWSTMHVKPSPAMAKGDMVLGAFKAGATVENHSSGRRFEMDYSGDDFTKGLVTFRTSERFALAVEYPGAFVRLKAQTQG